MMSLANNRLRGQGDPVRGDLPITPDTSHCGWFSSRHANPAQTLATGAMNVLAGANESSQALQKLLTSTSTISSVGGTSSDTDMNSFMDKASGQFGAPNGAGGLGTYGSP